jgi:hypothetical protein
MKLTYHFFFLLILVIQSCNKSPKLTPADRREDILFLAKWAKDYSPFVELNEEYKNCPSVDSIKYRYLDLAEKAEDNEKFFQVANGLFRLIGASGHAYIPSENVLKYLIQEFRINNPTNISVIQYKEGLYWNRLLRNSAIFAHPPFQIKFKNDEFFVNNDWHYGGKTILKGYKIIRVNGLPCSSYLDFIKQNTWIRYLAFNKDWINKYLLIIDEGNPLTFGTNVFNVELSGRRNSISHSFVLIPSSIDNGNNCTCLEIKRDVGYIRIKSFPYELTEKDGNLIRSFLDKFGGNYRKLIIDIRNHGGGATEYFYHNLIKPFLDKPVSYKQIAGIR